MREDAPFELLQGRARLEAELTVEEAPRFAQHGQCLCLAPAPVERERKLGPEPLPHRVPVDESLELDGEIGMPSQGEVGLDPFLERREPNLLEARDLPLREVLVREIRQR